MLSGVDEPEAYVVHEVCSQSAPSMTAPHPPDRPLSATVLICTFNRASLLSETLASLEAIRTTREWDVIVVDNNSTDDTRRVIEQAAPTFPVPLSYVFEPRQGKCYALNTGLDRAGGAVIAFTDDDVVVSPGWLDAACEALDLDQACDYTGGPVRPRWEVTPPRWLNQTQGDLWGTIAILDYGALPFTFEERRKVPIGANMAVRRRLIDRVGGFNQGLGRKGRALVGQEQAEFFARSRAVGAFGRYVPAMEVSHYVPKTRLTKRYFRRWWFWKGVARARMDAFHQVTELGVDLRTVPHVTGVPRYVLGACPRLAVRWVRFWVCGRRMDAAREEMLLCYTAGYICARWSRSVRPLSAATSPAPPETAQVS